MPSELTAINYAAKFRLYNLSTSLGNISLSLIDVILFCYVKLQ